MEFQKIERILAIPKRRRIDGQERFLEREKEKFIKVGKALIHIYETAYY